MAATLAGEPEEDDQQIDDDDEDDADGAKNNGAKRIKTDWNTNSLKS